ncbi:lysine 5,6-aminomutase reactivase subunit KamB [Fusibacter tunisiensis]|uniref:Uncharacterized protein n=1 Tax=Fusibacter tunisiensis TaxID=1008308 RepID=A0ABS2MNI0_9FIRM|nr:hypothetical protein [Fusibacter tunisiensis]MBM7560949.1 hypothetical protein [Fusibacter tunisiensis]
MGLYQLFENTYKIISIVGMAKNAGKTVTLNALIESLDQNGASVGLTSIGRDGERQDIVTKTDKPMIYVKKGTLIATAELLFGLSEVKMAVVEVTDHQTAMGRVIIGRTLADGYVQIGGPSSNSAVNAVAERMLGHGADYVLVDGALDRASSASPLITEACVLATGAVLSRDMTKAISKTVHKASLFNLPEASEASVLEYWGLAEESRQVISIDSENQARALGTSKTALSAGRNIGEWVDEQTKILLFPGALTTKTLMEIVHGTQHYKSIQFVVADATKLFIEHKDWQYFKRIGVDIRVRYGIKLLAITVNPYAPQGYFYDGALFKQSLNERLPEIPIVDVMEGDGL